MPESLESLVLAVGPLLVAITPVLWRLLGTLVPRLLTPSPHVAEVQHALEALGTALHQHLQHRTAAASQVPL